MKAVLLAACLAIGGCYAHGAASPGPDPTAPAPAFRTEMCPADPTGPWTTWPCPYSSYGPQKEIQR